MNKYAGHAPHHLCGCADPHRWHLWARNSAPPHAVASIHSHPSEWKWAFCQGSNP